jgi:DNA-binding beta-propeller fold protein YncE
MATTKLLTSFGIIVLGILAGSLTDLSGQTGGFAYVANCGSAEGCLSTGAGSISAYTIDGISGTLTEVFGSPYTAGLHPTSVVLDPTGRFAYDANYGSGDPPSTSSGSFSRPRY